MKFDVTLMPSRLGDMSLLARKSEAIGAAGLWISETAHNPFLALTLAASATDQIEIGTAVAIAFARSPMVTAQIAWDLAAQTGGRFILGLGSQVRAHITRRFGMPWSAPVPRMREYIEALHAIWASFQTGTPLRFRGDQYRLGLLTPFFNPGPIDTPEIPIFLAGVNSGMLALAGKHADGCHVHPFHTTAYLRDVIRPTIAQGAAAAGRNTQAIALSCAIFVVTGETVDARARSADLARTQIAFYASTPAYRTVLDHHGWGDLQPRLNELARAGRWGDMKADISDDLLAAFAVMAAPDELPHAVYERYAGLLDRIGYYLPFPDDTLHERWWQHSASVLAELCH